MGNWNFNIRGVGPHHNQNPEWDVDLIAREMVTKLVAGGHSVTSARLHYGAEEELAPAVSHAEEGETAGGRTPPLTTADGGKMAAAAE